MDDLASALKVQGFTARWQARELAAAVATARWSLAAAEARTESRGMHRRTDYPLTDPLQARRLIVSGVNAVTVSPKPAETPAARLKVAS